MCCMGAFARRGKSKVAPFVNEPAASERIEIRKDRWIRLIHYTPRSSAEHACRENGVKGNETEEFSRCSSSPERSTTTYAESTPDTNTVVIFFIHGVGGCAELWEAQLKYFHRAGYEVIAPDLLGHGGSCAPKDPEHYNFQEICSDTVELFDRYAKKRNILVGHSYGSSFCTVVAAERSRMVSKVVLISGGGPIPLRPDNCHLFSLPVLLLNCLEPFLACTFRRRAIHQHASRAIVKKTKTFHAPPFVLKAVMEGQLWEKGDETFHSELMVPVLLIYGAEDRFVTLQEEKWMHEAVFGSSLEVIPDAGHMVMLECPDRVNWLIHNFLKRDTSTQSQPQVKKRSQRTNVSKESIRNQIRKQTEARRTTLAVQSPILLTLEQSDKNEACYVKQRSYSLTHAQVIMPARKAPSQENLSIKSETRNNEIRSKVSKSKKTDRDFQDFAAWRKQNETIDFSSCNKNGESWGNHLTSGVNLTDSSTHCSLIQSSGKQNCLESLEIPGSSSKCSSGDENQFEFQQRPSKPAYGKEKVDRRVVVENNTSKSAKLNRTTQEMPAVLLASPPPGIYKSQCYF